MKLENFKDHLRRTFGKLSDMEPSDASSMIETMLQIRAQESVKKLEFDAMSRLNGAMKNDQLKADAMTRAYYGKLTTADAKGYATSTPARGVGISSGSVILDDIETRQDIPPLDKVGEWAIYYGYSLTRIEYESTDLSGTNKINLK